MRSPPPAVVDYDVTPRKLIKSYFSVVLGILLGTNKLNPPPHDEDAYEKQEDRFAYV